MSDTRERLPEGRPGSKDPASEPASASVRGRWPAVRNAAGGLLVLLLASLLAACGSGGQSNSSGQGGSKTQTVSVQVQQAQDGSVLVLVPVYINDHGPYTFVLDTGAAVSALDARLVDQLQLPVVGRAGAVVGIGGAERARLVRVDKWRVGDVTLPSTTVTDISLGAQNTQSGFEGLLGSDLLSQFGTITIDYKNHTITLGSK